MSQGLKTLLNNFFIGIFAVIPIVIVLQIIIFVKDRVSDLFRLVYGYSDSYAYTLLGIKSSRRENFGRLRLSTSSLIGFR